MLPDLTKLSAADDAALVDFRARCVALGISLDGFRPLVSSVSSVQPHLRGAVKRARLRARRDPRAIAMRALLVEDTVDEAEAKTAFGDALPWMLEVGLLAAQPSGRLHAPFALALLDDRFVLSDLLRHGGDAAMGMSATTVHLAMAAHPRRRVGRVLDLGTGAGAVALALSRAADHVIATDVNPRALAFVAINARMNDVRNVEPRLGSLFEPVPGERFDVIASQPPFIALPDDATSSTFLYGGRRGDELALELLSGLPAHLAERGLGVALIEWPDDGTPIDRRVGRVVSDADVVILGAPPAAIEENAAGYAAGLHPALDAAFELELARRLSHFEALSFRALVPSLTIVRRREGGRARMISTGPLAATAPTRKRLDALLDAGALADDPVRLAKARLRIPEGTVLAQEQEGPGADRPSTIRARFAPEALLAPLVMTEELLLLLTCVHEAESVARGVERFAEAFDRPVAAALAAATPVLERALREGLLEER